MRSRSPSCRPNALRGLRAGACGGLAVMLASFSLLLQALLPLMPATPMAGGAGMPAGAMATLCLTRDASAPDPHRVPARPAPSQGIPVCPVCLGLHLVAAYVPPPALAIPLPRRVDDVRAAVRSAAAPAEAWSVVPQARGPPITA
jgi:hypothetical protein